MAERRIVLPPAPPSPSSTFLGFARLPPPSLPQLQLSSPRPSFPSPTKPARRSVVPSKKPRQSKRRRVAEEPPVFYDQDLHESPPPIDAFAGVGSLPGVILVDGPQVTQIHSTDLTGYEAYVEAVNADAAGFCQLSVELFVVQGWSSRTASATVCISFLSCSQFDLTAFYIETLVSPAAKSDRRYV